MSTADHHLDHVLEYENHSGLDNAWKKIPGSDVGSMSLDFSYVFHSILFYFLLLHSTREPTMLSDLFSDPGLHSSRRNLPFYPPAHPVRKAVSLNCARTS